MKRLIFRWFESHRGVHEASRRAARHILVIASVTFIMVHSTSVHAATVTCTTSGNWSNPAIWSGGVVPTISDDVIIRGAATVTLDMNASAQTLKLGSNATSTDGGILIMPSTPYNLDVNGDVTLGSNPGAGLLSMVNGILTVRGSMFINSFGVLIATGGSVWYAVTSPATAAGATYNKLNIVSGDVSADGLITVKSDFTLSAAATFHPGLYEVTVKGDWLSLGTFDDGGGSVSLEGSTTQNITMGSHFNRLSIGGSSTAVALNGLTIDGDFTIYTGATFDGGHYVHTIGGDWSNAGTFLAGTSTVKLSSIGIQNVYGGTTFHHLTMTGGGPKEEFDDITVEGNLTVDAGTEFHGNGFRQHIRGNFTLNGTFDVNGTAVTYFDGTGDQSIPPDLVLNDLVLGSANTKTALGNLVINRDLTINAGVTFDAGSASSVDTIKGRWTNNGTLLPHGGLVVFKSPSTQSIKGATIFSDVTFMGAGAKIVDGDLTVNGNFTISPAATVQMDTSAAVVKGDWVSNGTFDAGTGTVTLNGAGAQSIAGTTTFNNLILGGGNTKTANDPLTINGDLTIRAGTTFDPGTVTHHVNGDWIKTGTFLANAGTIDFSGIRPQVITGAFRFNNVTVDNDSGVSLVSTLGDSIQGALTFTNGRMNLGGTDLTLQLAATVTGAAEGKCIITNGTGRVRRRIQGGASAGIFTFPIAPNKTSYNPLAIALRPNLFEPTETFTVRVEEFTNASIGFSVTDTAFCTWRIWTIEEETIGGNRTNLAFQWDPNEDGTNIGINPADSVQAMAYLYDNGTGRYEAVDDAVGPPHLNNPVVAATLGYTTMSFGSYIVGNAIALSTQVVSFTGVEIPQVGVRLDWRTLSEVNNFGFYLQRKREADSTWTELSNSFRPGYGTTNEPHDYSFVDTAVAGGMWQYRLRQMGLAGTSRYSEPITVSVLTDVKEPQLPTEFALRQNYPNPFNPTTNISLDLPSAGDVMLKVYDMLGREVATLVNEARLAGRYTERFDATGLASGVYLYRLTTPLHSATKKLVVLR